MNTNIKHNQYFRLTKPKLTHVLNNSHFQISSKPRKKSRNCQTEAKELRWKVKR